MSLLARSSVRSYSTASSSSISNIRAGIILTRHPIVSKDEPLEEKIYHRYKEELERRLMWTFPKWYYFKKGSISGMNFNAAQKHPSGRQPGVVFPRGLPDIRNGRDRRFKQEIIIPKKQLDLQDPNDIARPIKPNSRITKADETNDTKSLERALPRTLYLLIQDGASSNWILPSFELLENEPLHVAAERGLRVVGGDALHTWTVSNTPLALLKKDDLKEYLIKSRILAGQFKPTAESQIKDFGWFTKQEAAKLATKEYFDSIEHLLSDY